MEKTVSREVAERLREAGIEVESFWHCEDNGAFFYCKKPKNKKWYPAPMLHEILEIMPSPIVSNGTKYFLETRKHHHSYSCYYQKSLSLSGKDKNTILGNVYINNNLADAVAELLIWCKKEGYLNNGG